jgi:hypothetical protein
VRVSNKYPATNTTANSNTPSYIIEAKRFNRVAAGGKVSVIGAEVAIAIVK